MHNIFDEESQVVSELNSTICNNNASVIESCLYSGIDDMHAVDDASSKISSGPWGSDNSWTSSSELLPESSSSEYCPTPLKKARFHTISLENGLFVCQTSQVQAFIDQINDMSVCYTPFCAGKLVPIAGWPWCKCYNKIFMFTMHGADNNFN